jgi:hypothetical protein
MLGRCDLEWALVDIEGALENSRHGIQSILRYSSPYLYYVNLEIPLQRQQDPIVGRGCHTHEAELKLSPTDGRPLIFGKLQMKYLQRTRACSGTKNMNRLAISDRV